MDGTQGRDRRAYGDLQQIGGARLVTLEDGPERGVRVIEFRTSTGIELGVIVDRALDLGWCRHHGRSVAWHSPTGFVGPWYREPQGLGFLRSFPGGPTVTCGLDHILFPEDPARDAPQIISDLRTIFPPAATSSARWRSSATARRR